MKKQNLVFLLSTVLTVFTWSACSDHTVDDVTAPHVHIHTPAAGASISGAVSITGDVTDESLHELSIVVTKDADGSVLFTASPTVHDLTEYEINQTFTPSVAAETAVTLVVTAADHSDHSTTETVHFTVKP